MHRSLLNIVGYAISLNAVFLTLFFLIQIYLRGSFGFVMLERNPIILFTETILILFSIIFISFRMYKESTKFWDIYYKRKKTR